MLPGSGVVKEAGSGLCARCRASEVNQEIVGGDVTLDRILGQHFSNNAFEFAGKPPIEVPQGLVVFFNDAIAGGQKAFGQEWVASSQRFIKDNAKRKNVGAFSSIFSLLQGKASGAMYASVPAELRMVAYHRSASR